MFEWDEAKSRANLAKHGVSFEDAARIFEGTVLTLEDDRFEYGEVRSLSIGVVGASRVVAVSHTDRDGVTRIISARRATPRERRMYDARIAKG